MTSLSTAVSENDPGTGPQHPGWYQEFIARRRPNYRFSWQIYSEVLQENLKYRKSWLDLGCGNNRVVAENQLQGFKIGLDRKLHPQLKSRNFCVGNLYRLPFREGSFDMITCRYAIEHLEQPEKMLEAASRVLKRGGILILQTTNLSSLWIKLSKLIPFGLKRFLLGKFLLPKDFGLEETFYRMNHPELFPKFVCRMRLEGLYLLEDLLRFGKLVFWGSFLYLSLLDLLRLKRFRSNVIAVYRKL